MPEFHPLANAFPLLDEDSDEFMELVKDIETNGLIHPIVMFEGKVLDGRNRSRAFDKINEGRPVNDRLPHREIKFTGDDAAAYVWSINVVRRHLTPSQRAMAAQALESLGWGGQPGNLNAVAGDVPNRDTRARIAKRTGASVKSMDRAARVRREGVPKVAKAVEEGDLALATADRLVRKPKDEQEKIMEEIPVEEIHKVVPDPRWDPELAPEGGNPPETPRKVAGANRLRPLTLMKEQLKASSSAGEASRVKFWTEHRDQISRLPKDDLASFVKDMNANRRAITQLLSLIKAETETTEPPKATAARTPRKRAAAKKAPAGTEVKGS
jgi:ParB family chromosome partitioning protein